MLASAPAFVRLATGFRTVRLYTSSPTLPPVVPGSIRAPICAAEGTEALGWAVGADPENAEHAVMTARRLNEVCRVLGKLLSACSEIADAHKA